MGRKIVLLAGTLWVLWHADVHIASNGSLSLTNWKAEQAFDTKAECETHRIAVQPLPGYVPCLPEGKRPTDFRPKDQQRK
jgi:hypothetical protein